MLKYILALLYTFSISMVNAQFVAQKSWLHITMDNNQVGSFFKHSFADALKINKASFSLGLEQYLTKDYNISATLSFGKVSDYQSNLTEVQDAGKLRAGLTGFKVLGVLKLNNGMILPPDSPLMPIIGAGVGMVRFTENVVAEDAGVSIMVPLLAGVRYRFTENMQLEAKVSHHTTKTIDYRSFSAGFSFSLTNKVDTDLDGIYDRDDQCPETFGPLENNGCPYPDADDDGFNDLEDRCPLIAGALMGCPDVDQDSIPDHIDKCPEIFGSTLNEGCPEQKLQKANTPNDSTTLARKKQNIVSPTNQRTTAYKENLLQNEENKRNLNRNSISNDDSINSRTIDGNIPIEELLFDFNSKEINISYYNSLHELAYFLASNPTIKVSVNGFTDSIGQEDTNLRLSIQRANMVKIFLINNGVNSNQLIVNGFGEIHSVASNDSEEKLAKNRRVEIKIIPKAYMR